MRRKVYIIISLILSAAVLANVSVFAVRPDTITADTVKFSPLTMQLTNERTLISQLNSDILSLKAEGTGLIAEIKTDLKEADTVDSSMSASKNYTAVLGVMAGLKTNLQIAESIRYKDALKKADGLKGGDCLKQLTDTVEPMLQQKKKLLENAVNILNQAAAKAAVLSGQNESSSSSADSSAKTRIAASYSSEISQSYDTCRSLISQIIATIAANQNTLTAGQVTPVETNLVNISKTLRKLQNDSLIQANQSFRNNQESGNHAQADTDLNNILSIQRDRISTLSKVENQLEQILDHVNGMLDTQSGPSGSTAA